MCGAQAYITSTWLVLNTMQVNVFSWLNMYAYYFCSTKASQVYTSATVFNIQGVPGGMDKTSGECSLCQTIPI